MRFPVGDNNDHRACERILCHDHRTPTTRDHKLGISKAAVWWYPDNHPDQQPHRF